MVKYSQSRSAVLNPKAKTERKNKPCADSQDLEGGQLSPLKLSSISLTAAVWKGAHHAAGMFLAIPPPGHPVGVSQSRSNPNPEPSARELNIWTINRVQIPSSRNEPVRDSREGKAEVRHGISQTGQRGPSRRRGVFPGWPCTRAAPYSGLL
jgi:hypothetical protein